MTGLRVAHLTTVDTSLRYLVLPQLLAVRDAGGEAIGISAPGSHVEELEAVGIRHIPLASSTREMDLVADLRAAWELWGILRRERFDVLHTHNPKPGLYGRVLGRLARVPVVVNTVHGLYATPDDPMRKRLLVYGLEAVAARFSDLELVQSREDYDLLTRRHLTPPSRTIHLGNGVDLARFDPARFTREDRAGIRAELGASEETVVVGMVSRLVAEKGYPELFEAARRLDDRFLVVCIGPDDPDKADALPREALAAAAAVGVRFLGMRTDVDRLYAGMDLFVLPSHREGFPRAAMEAAAMGLPVVATDIRGCREVVESGVNGLLVGVADPASLVAAIQRLADDPEERLAMGAEGRRIARERFDERRVVEAVMGSYRSVRAERSTGGRLGRALKRAVDVLVSLTLMVLLAPVMAVVAVMVRVFIGQPVIFRQERPGLHGRPFTLVKFRTMSDAVDPDGNLLPDSERLTRLGVALRRSSLDELPELLNVLRGEMSLVGPRPLLVDYLDRYSARQRRRHDMKPGITGWAQVRGRNAITWEEKLELDVWYVENWSLRLDLQILAMTFAAVVRRTGINEPGRETVSEFMGSPGEEEDE